MPQTPTIPPDDPKRSLTLAQLDSASLTSVWSAIPTPLPLLASRPTDVSA